MKIKCTSCQIEIEKFKYQLKKINKDTYLCKTCKVLNGRIKKECPVCSKVFETLKSEDKKTCSYSCSNKFFRRGEQNGNWKNESYRSTCFLYHKKECVVCGEDKIVEVHHFDENRNNNNPANLIPLCPNHHQYLHSKFKYLIVEKVKEYRNKFVEKVLS
jgi:hypothetical protein